MWHYDVYLDISRCRDKLLLGVGTSDSLQVWVVTSHLSETHTSRHI